MAVGRAAIPTRLQVLADENALAPGIKNFKRKSVNAIAVGFEKVVFAVAVRGESSGQPNGEAVFWLRVVGFFDFD